MDLNAKEVIEAYSVDLVSKILTAGDMPPTAGRVYNIGSSEAGERVWDCLSLGRSPVPSGFIVMRKGQSLLKDDFVSWFACKKFSAESSTLSRWLTRRESCIATSD